ncbi:nickel-dependent hydrogenase large subunit [Sulfurimonas sp.]|uniref:nickel-dependent hydrogenase large subunit n=1 Tax=Sulfurimonas sp. TaxID=2022749 RepID=UPI002AB0B688|nr:nickel-dependent hydrogenase large subunit [Sulfurimonas sp.]
MIKLIEKIEGEAKLNFKFKNKKIDFIDIEFMSTRSIEKILEGKPAQDALVINPRVCGICGHAHLIATVKALEACYDDLKISKKAEILRELTLNFELIQNHFKWFYLTMRPLFGEKQELLKATYPAQLMAKAIAIFGGQYPHTSYAIIGGVVCDITEMDIIKITHYLDETVKFFKDNVIDGEDDNLLACTNVDKVLNKKGDLADILKEIKKREWMNLGKSYDRFIVFGQNSYFNSGKSVKTRLMQNLSYSYVKEEQSNNSFAKNVSYKDKYFEVGPLARAMVNKVPLIKDAHRKYADSIFTRILARVCETAQLLAHSKKLLKELDLSEPSYIKPSVDISKINGIGQGSVEAARGSLIHKVELENGIIKNYEIITPTQWNLSGGTKKKQGVSQKAMIGLSDVKVAELVFKTFDVCSVCTTH